MAKPLDFFFFYGSIHTYLSVMRIEALAAKARVQLRWHPFNLREILIEQGNTAFARNSVRLAYNWRDIERRAALLGIAFKGPAPYPVEPVLLALRVGTIAAAVVPRLHESHIPRLVPGRQARRRAVERHQRACGPRSETGADRCPCHCS